MRLYIFRTCKDITRTYWTDNTGSYGWLCSKGWFVIRTTQMITALSEPCWNGKFASCNWRSRFKLQRVHISFVCTVQTCHQPGSWDTLVVCIFVDPRFKVGKYYIWATQLGDKMGQFNLKTLRPCSTELHRKTGWLSLQSAAEILKFNPRRATFLLFSKLIFLIFDKNCWKIRKKKLIHKFYVENQQNKYRIKIVQKLKKYDSKFVRFR